MSDAIQKRIETIEGIWVETPNIRAVNRAMDDSLERSLTSAEPICRRVAGDSGTGKSITSQNYQKRHPPFKEGNALRVPVLWLEAPVSARPGALALVLLSALGIPIKPGARLNLEEAVATIIRRIGLLGVLLILIDEFQQVLEGKHNEVNMRQSANVMKRIINEARVPFIVFGLPEAERILKEDSQLRARMRSPLFLPNYDYRNAESRKLLFKLLGEFAKRTPFSQTPPFAEAAYALPIYQSGSGNPRLMANVVRAGCNRAVRDGSATVELHHLAEAFETEMREVTGMAFPNPFRTPPAPPNIVAPGSWVRSNTKWMSR